MNDVLLESERVTLVDLLDRLLETGVVADGEVDLSVADIDLIHLGLKLVLASSATLERHNNGGTTCSTDPPDNPLGKSPGEYSFGSTISSGAPILTEAESQVGAVAQPSCRAETVLSSRPSPEPELHGEGLCPSIDRFDGTRCLPARSIEKAFSKTDPERVPPAGGRVGRSDFEPAKIEHGLAKLVLTLVELIRRLLEKQAIRKMEGGTLTAIQVERLGEAFRQLEIKMEELKHVFGLKDDELNLDLGPLGSLM